MEWCILQLLMFFGCLLGMVEGLAPSFYLVRPLWRHVITLCMDASPEEPHEVHPIPGGERRKALQRHDHRHFAKSSLCTWMMCAFFLNKTRKG